MHQERSAMDAAMSDAENSTLNPGMDKNTNIMYIDPDKLTPNQLVYELKKRSILGSKEDHCSLQKEHLVFLFKKYVIPLPRRKKYKNLSESQNPGEMLKYIKSSSSKRKRESALVNEEHPEEPDKGMNGGVVKKDEMNKPLKNIVCISTKSNEQQRKPVKLKRKNSRTSDDVIMNIKRNVKNIKMDIK